MTTADATGFGALLRQLRLAAGLTQEALAERAGVSAKAVSDLERGPSRSPRLATVALLAAALGLDPAGRARLLAAARPETGPPAVPPPAAPRAARPATPPHAADRARGDALAPWRSCCGAGRASCSP